MRTALALMFACIALSVDYVRAAGPRIEIVLDVSGSMRSALGSEAKIDAAKRAIRETVSGIPDGSVVALRYYGHRVAQEQKDASCKDTELVVQFRPIDKPAFLSALGSAMPRGQTPIAYSLQQAAEDFGPVSDEERALILVSDGIETCGGDPLATVRDLAAKGFKVKVHTIGFDVDAAARAQLTAISNATGGEYYDARSASALSDSLRKLTTRSLLIERDSTFGEPIRGGQTYGEAVEIKPGVAYHLDHHQRINEFDYFFVEARGGQKIEASIQSFDKGIQIRGEKVGESASAYAGIGIHSPDQQKIIERTVFQAREKVTISVPLGDKDGRFYILVGNNSSDQHQNSRFNIALVDLFDASSGRDAGADDKTAVEVGPGTHTGHFHANDDADMYSINVSPGATYSFRVKPNGQEKALHLEVFDRDLVSLKKMDAPNPGAAVRLEDIKFPYSGKAFISVKSGHYAGNVEDPYALDVTSSGESAAPAAAAAPAAGTTAAPAAAATSAPSAATETAAATGFGAVGIALGVLGVVVLVAGAYMLGRRRS